MGLFIVLGVIWLAVSLSIAEEFAEIAVKKGYSDRKYFWYCFLFSIAGYLMVIALPEKKDDVYDNQVQNVPDKEPKAKEYVGDFPSAGFSEGDGIKQCLKCGTCYDSALTVCPSCKNNKE